MKMIQSIAALCLTSSLAYADLDKEVRLDDCPEAVRKTIVENSRDGKIDDISLIAIEDQQIFIAEVDLARDIDLKVFVAQDGKLVKTREDVRDDEIPSFVIDFVKTLSGRVDDVEKEVSGEIVTYHVDVDRSGQPDLEVVFDAEGKVVEQTEEVDD